MNINYVAIYFDIPKSKRLYSRKEISARIGIDTSTLSNIISGHRKLAKDNEIAFFNMTHLEFSKPHQKKIKKILIAKWEANRDDNKIIYNMYYKAHAIRQGMNDENHGCSNN